MAELQCYYLHERLVVKLDLVLSPELTLGEAHCIAQTVREVRAPTVCPLSWHRPFWGGDGGGFGGVGSRQGGGDTGLNRRHTRNGRFRFEAPVFCTFFLTDSFDFLRLHVFPPSTPPPL